MSNARTGAPVLHHDIVRSDTEPGSWLYVLHGIFGAGRNWATVARRLVAERPDWGAVLVDLRQHGASQGFPPPHTLASAAADLSGLAAHIDRPARAVLGHSFGGKVALQWAAGSVPSLEQVWVIDSTPDAGQPRGSAWHMLQTVRALPDSFPSREAAVQDLIGHGVADPVARWMATNLARNGDTVHWRFDSAALEALLLDFFRTDLWNVPASAPDGMSIHFVKAEESSILTPEALGRIEGLAAGGRVRLATLEGGHWLNADNPDGVVALLAAGLPANET